MSIKPSSNVFAIRPMPSLLVWCAPSLPRSSRVSAGTRSGVAPSLQALRLWAEAHRRQSVGGHFLGQQAMEALQAQRATIAPDEEMSLAPLPETLRRWRCDDAASHQWYPNWVPRR